VLSGKEAITAHSVSEATEKGVYFAFEHEKVSSGLARGTGVYARRNPLACRREKRKGELNFTVIP